MVLADVNGATIAYDDAGSGGPAFVFVHGFGCDRESWRPQFEELSATHRCITVDLRGRGESSAAAPYTAVQAADDVARLIEQLGIGPVVLAGHSLGGIVAVLLHEAHPDLVLGLVACDTPFEAVAQGALGQLVSMVNETGAPPAIAEGFIHEGTPPEVATYIRTVLADLPPEVALGMADDSSGYPARMVALLKAADRKPFMTLWAGNGQMTAGAYLREHTMFTRQETVPGTAHFLQLEKPDVTNALLRAFLDDIDRDPRIAEMRESASK